MMPQPKRVEDQQFNPNKSGIRMRERPASDEASSLVTPDSEQPRSGEKLSLRPLASVKPAAHAKPAASVSRMSHAERLTQLGVLTANVAHEVNNPAAFIMTNVSMMKSYLEVFARASSLLKEVAEQLPEEHAAQLRTQLSELDMDWHVEDFDEMCDDNLAGIKHISRIVDALRHFARDGQQLTALSINQVIDSALQLTSKTLRERATLQVSVAPMPQLLGETTRLAQVIMNLLQNASQAFASAAPQENRIALRVERDGDTCLISVEDNGAGMSPQTHARIFEPFFTTKPAGSGTGLGLALCRDIVRMHGGTIRCSSTEGQGSRFEVRLPLPSPPAPANDCT